MNAFTAGDLARMLDVVDRAYADRVAPYVADQLDLARVVAPEAFATVDVEDFRREVERDLRAAELDDWPDELGRVVA